MEEKSILYQQSKIFYRLIGKGKPVMLLHGFGEDGDVWNGQVSFLKDHFQLIIPDIPGSGMSEFIQDANIETYAEIIKAILDAELNSNGTQESISLIGHSMGGYITLAFAEKYPAYLNSFGLFHSSAFADNDEKKQTRLKAIDFIKTNGAHAFLKTSTPALFTKEFTSAQPSRIDELIEAGKIFTSEALIQYYNAMIDRPDRTNILRTFNKPILFIIGEHDTAIPLQASLQQCHIPSRSHVHILKHSAHMGMWEEADKANEIMLEFLR
ncbi:MAG: alpha/beta hydrolase [Ferruginibacter sp.]